jgi:hypothetical protein
MPQLISKDVGCFLSHTQPTWDAPTIQALPNDYIWRRDLPTLRILGRTNYPNGNVALTATEAIDRTEQPIDAVFLLSDADELIAMPNIHYGDIITIGGIYQPFDALLWPGIILSEYTGFSPWSRLWRVLVGDQVANRLIQQTKKGYEAGGNCYRSLYQAANSIAEPLMLPLTGLPF